MNPTQIKTMREKIVNGNWTSVDVATLLDEIEVLQSSNKRAHDAAEKCRERAEDLQDKLEAVEKDRDDAHDAWLVVGAASSSLHSEIRYLQDIVNRHRTEESHCEGCNHTAIYTDSQGVPLCWACLKSLIMEEMEEPNEQAAERWINERNHAAQRAAEGVAS